MNLLAASAWTADITSSASQVVTDMAIGITAGLTIFVVVFGVRKVLGSLKASSK